MANMRAVVMTHYGGREVLDLQERPVPQPGANDLLIAVRAASLNPVDWKIREGKLKAALRFPMPHILGRDLAGEVVEAGPQVTAFKAGDQVYACVEHEGEGTLAEFAVTDAANVAPMPSNLSYEEAASLPLVGLTSWQALVGLMNLQAGQKILVHAGAGGVGTFAVQLAKHRGAYVAATASPHNHGLLTDLGVDRCIDYHSEDFTDVCKGYDAIFDTLGGKTLRKSIDTVREGGWVVNITDLPDPQTAREMGLPWFVRLGLRFATRKVTAQARGRGVNYRMLLMHSDGATLREIAGLVEQGAIRPVIDTEYAMDGYKEAFEKLETGHARGKVVLKMA